MHRVTAGLLGILLPLLGLAGTGQAQSSVQVQGIIEAVDCQAQTLVLTGAGASNTIVTAPYTAVLVDSASVPFCALQQYVGAPATVWLLATGSEFVATRIDVAAASVAVPPPPESPPAPAIASLPIAGIVLGTIIVAGLVYLLVRDGYGHYYRYPYYGPYYHYYYRPWYRPYVGPYPALAPVILAPRPLVGIVLGTAIVAGLEYLVVRDRDGRIYRYPYYGPYRQYYYRPGYRPYVGQGYDAPIRQGDPRWDSPATRGAPLRGGPAYPDPRNRLPAPHGAGAPAGSPATAPAHPVIYQRDEPRTQDPRNRVPVRQHAQTPMPVPPGPQVGPVPRGATVSQPVPRDDRHGRPGGPPAYQDYGNGRQYPQGLPYRGAPVYRHAPGYGGSSADPSRYRTDRRADPGDRRCSGAPANQTCQSGGQGAPGR